MVPSGKYRQRSPVRYSLAPGVAAGVMAADPDSARYVEAGATMVILGSDLALLVRGADALAAKFVQPVS